MSKKPLVLIIRDGWGVSGETKGNAALVAKTPVYDALLKKYPHALLAASGEAVGLPDGQMGNSEVGHLNFGAGRIVYQEFTRITKSIRDGDFFANDVLIAACRSAREKNSSLHLAGLLSDGGVHSHMDHLYALLKLAKDQGVRNVYVHAILDGRDTSPTGGIGYVGDLLGKMKEIGAGRIATVMGRYYIMDRDNRWERVEKAYRAMVDGIGEKAADPAAAVKASYDKDVTDEFVVPVVMTQPDGAPVATVKKDDSFIFFNFRSDRAREITRTFVSRDFDKFARPKELFPHYVCITEYDASFNAPVAFPPQSLKNIFGEVISRAGLKQLRIAETEKYAHVTFFFNGGVETPFPNEDRCLIPSPKVPTYDMQPEMSAKEVTDQVVKRIQSKAYDVVILNYANPDMVGHTGNMAAVVKAVETVDACVGRVIDAVRAAGGVALVTADHGNEEKMIDLDTGEPFTAHTTNPVDFILVDDAAGGVRVRDGILADVAPTMLSLLGIPIPAEMTGKDLVVRDLQTVGR
ncbi:MAG TPA: 2,3-bisphosphoglycerate-independent phosphoglycerate mutase [bacterium]|nr:2,3-bisphosphoglycerate-independent phosphoglycerate mutase [bacterium]